MRFAFILSALAAGLGFAAAATGAPEELVYLPGSTHKICQLTGDFDRAAGVPTLSQTGKRFGILATDLGSSFEHKGKLYFLFGDTIGRPGDWDALGWTDSTDPAKLRLDFHKEKDGKWLPPRVPGIKQGAFEVPSYGTSIGGVMYVVFTTDHSPQKVMGRSVLASSHDDGRSFRMLYELSRDKFINVAFWQTGGWLYIYGSGEYRKSSVCLARVKPTEIGDRSRLEYFRGTGPDHEPRWSRHETDAVPLFHHDVVGEFSVAYLKPVQRQVMLYNSLTPRGIVLRSSRQPWGPWSEITLIFEPWRDHGYGHFLHISAKFKKQQDNFNDPGRANDWGAEYGPYLMARFTRPVEGKCRIYYTMSTWNPYQVIIMRSDLQLRAKPK